MAQRLFGHIILFSIALSSFGCQQQNAEPDLYAQPQPAHFVRLPDATSNPLTAEGVALGRRLFYDPLLSRDSTISCASCHLPERAFTDGKAIATGVGGEAGFRNAPSLANLAWINEGLFWDGRSPTLEHQALEPVENPHEMDSDWPTVLQRLRAQTAYVEAFRAAFGIRKASEINKQLAARALAQFQRTLVSADSKYDRVVRGEAAFTALEQRGRDIFFDASAELPDGECGHCHTPPLFTDQTYINNGSQPSADLMAMKDRGRGGVTGVKYENGRFRVPSLRNVALSAPYMHNGSMATLEEVIEHYNRGGHPGTNVDPKIRPLGLSETDKTALIAFLHTLTDTTFTQNPAHRSPF
mgnify:CR=1 FL=1